MRYPKIIREKIPLTPWNRFFQEACEIVKEKLDRNPDGSIRPEYIHPISGERDEKPQHHISKNKRIR